MASVSKLVLMPIDMWHRLSKDRKNIDLQSMKTIKITSANQSGTGNVPSPLEPPAMLEGLVVVGAGSLPPSLSPSPPPRRRKKGKEEGGTQSTSIEKILAKRRHP